ncbi:MAG: alpha/beta hydrolase [Phycisphaerales bacterium]|nr:alpha/beta hydrolase [Phycisphaerales bacterium]
MKRSILKLFTCLLFASTTTLSVASPEPIADNWHADLKIPTRTLSLIFVITQDEEGQLSAHMESPDQSPGQKIPVSEVTVVDNHLSIALSNLGASIEADWDDENQHWTGTFSQGIDLPIIIKRGLPENKPTIEGLDGTWKSTINRNGVDLRIILHITTTERGTSAKVDSPDTMAMNIPVSDLAREGDSVHYKLPIIDGVFTGSLIDVDTLSGTWVVPGNDDITITYVRSEESESDAVRNRPQVPSKPYGYITEEVVYDNMHAEGVTLAGTLTLPEGDGPFPAAILISGSGPQDRNETVFGHQPFLVLADHLTKQGIAVLRYDDRGVAESTGDFSAATSADFATDANAACAYLLTRSEIDHDSIGFIGHSEGGLIAPIAIQDNSTVSFMVMLAGPGTSSQQIVLSQNRLIALSQGTSEEVISKNAKINKKIAKAVAESSSVEDAAEQVRAILTPEAMKAMGVNETQVDMIVAQNSTPWTRYFLGYDPVNFLPQIDIPILALNGELDLQVPSQENLDGLRSMLKDHPDATIIELEGLNHMFQHAKTGAMGEYNDIEETFSPEAMSIVADWINTRFGNNE